MCNTHTTCPWEAIFSRSGGESLNNVGTAEVHVYFVCEECGQGGWEYASHEILNFMPPEIVSGRPWYAWFHSHIPENLGIGRMQCSGESSHQCIQSHREVRANREEATASSASVVATPLCSISQLVESKITGRASTFGQSTEYPHSHALVCGGREKEPGKEAIN